MDYAWPGNVRELQHVVERAVILTQASIIGVDDLPEAIAATTGQDVKRNYSASLRLSLTISQCGALRPLESTCSGASSSSSCSHSRRWFHHLGGPLRRRRQQALPRHRANLFLRRGREALVPAGRASLGRAAGAASRPICSTPSWPSRTIASTRTPASIPSASAARCSATCARASIEEGASTLTQQLARTIFLTNQRNFGRKFKEMVLALMIERRLDKQKILELYLNRILPGRQRVRCRSDVPERLRQERFGPYAVRSRISLRDSSGCPRPCRPGPITTARSSAAVCAAPECAKKNTSPPRLNKPPAPFAREFCPSPGLTAGAAGYAEDYLRQQFKSQFEDDNPPDWKVQTTFLPGCSARQSAR